MGIEMAVAVGALVIGAGGTAYSAMAQQAAAKKQRSALRDAQKDNQKVEMAMQNEQAARERRAQIREARVKRAMVANTAAATGQEGSSAAIVGGQAVTGQAGVNIGAINTAQSYANIQGISQQRIADAQSMSTSPGIGAQLAGGIGSSLMNIGLTQGTKSIFKE
jgi:hypothetical protein